MRGLVCLSFVVAAAVHVGAAHVYAGPVAPSCAAAVADVPCMVRPGVTAYLGLSRTGKSTLALKHLRQSAARALIFDPRASETMDAVPALHNRGDVMRFFAKHSSGKWMRTVRSHDSSLYAWLATTVPHWRGVTWVIDDAHSLLSVPAVHDAALEVGVGGRHMGGRMGVELWVITHRPYMLPADIRSQASRFYCFRQPSPGDLRYLAGWCGDDYAARVRQLPDFQFATWEGA